MTLLGGEVAVVLVCRGLGAALRRDLDNQIQVSARLLRLLALVARSFDGGLGVVVYEMRIKIAPDTTYLFPGSDLGEESFGE